MPYSHCVEDGFALIELDELIRSLGSIHVVPAPNKSSSGQLAES